MTRENIIGLVVTLVASIISWAIAKIRAKLDERSRKLADEIAAVVEQMYDGCPANEKLAAFREIAKKRGLNVKKAVSYLESRIIPLSKKINIYSDSSKSTSEKLEPTD